VPVEPGVLLRRGFAPADLLGAVLAAGLLLLRLVADPCPLPCVAAALAAPVVYRLAHYLLWLDGEARALVGA
jgi:hypothetical protein